MSLDILSRLKDNLNKSGRSGTRIDYGTLLEDQLPGSDNLALNPYDLFHPMPAYTTVLGICEDGLPLVLDMNDPNPGAILISGRRHTGKSELMKSILYSACSTNNNDQIYFYLISPEPGNQTGLEQLAHCYGVLSSYDKAACELIYDLAALIEQRKSGRHLGAKCILAIDNLYELIKHQDFDVLNHLKWLFRYGASNGIWVISTIDDERQNLIEHDLLAEQKTQILTGTGRNLLPDQTATYLEGINVITYKTRIGNDWINFWLPSTGY